MNVLFVFLAVFSFVLYNSCFFAMRTKKSCTLAKYGEKVPNFFSKSTKVGYKDYTTKRHQTILKMYWRNNAMMV